MQLRRVRVGALVLASAAALALTAGPALASAQGHRHMRVTGPEVISGFIHGKAANASNPHIPLVLRGVVNTIDPTFVLGNGHRQTHTLRTLAGRLTVRGIGKQHQTQTFNPRTCRVSFTIRQEFRFIPFLSTGRFAGATGPGAYQIRFSAILPRHHSGKHRGRCNTSNHAKPLNRGAFVSFLAAGVLTVSR
jgi:hypothetical protein